MSARGNVKHYGVGEGPMAHLLRIIRDAPGPLTTGEVYDKAVEREVKVHSRRHMKGLLGQMKKIERVDSNAPPRGDNGKRAKNFIWSLTSRGALHIWKIESHMGVSLPKPDVPPHVQKGTLKRLAKKLASKGGKTPLQGGGKGRR